MRLLHLFVCLVLSVLSRAQSAQVTTSFIIQETTGSNQLIGTVSTPTVITIGPTATSNSTVTGSSASPTGNSTAGGSSSGNSTNVVSSNLPTASNSAAGANGGGPGGSAPSPGTSASGGIYGPPDGYISGAEALRSAAMLGGVGFVIGAVVTFV